MKFTITREQLQEGLAAVAAAIPAKTTLPVLLTTGLVAEVARQRWTRRGPWRRDLYLVESNP